MEKKIIHILGGGINQISLVKKAQEFGLKTLVTDMYENPPAKVHADYFEQIDTTDIQKSFECAKRYKINYVISDMTDVSITTVAYIAEQLKLPGIGYETALKFTNKYLMRNSLKSLLPQHIPEYHFFNDVEQAIQFARTSLATRKFVAKPINAQGSKGVYILSSDLHLQQMQIRTAFAEGREVGVLIEEYVGDFEYSVETFVHNEKVHPLTLTKKYHYQQNPCLDERNTYLNDIDPEFEHELFSVNEKIIYALGLPFGLTHAEYKFHNGKIYLMEIAARGAGGSIASHIIPYLTEFDTLGTLLKIHLGLPFEIKIKDYKNKYAVLRFFNFKPGTVKNVFVNQKIADKAAFFSFLIRPHDVIQPVRDSRDRPGYFVVLGTNRDEVLETEKQILSAVTVEYDTEKS
jgi:carbamoyl-phosphate synthase large subunit